MKIGRTSVKKAMETVFGSTPFKHNETIKLIEQIPDPETRSFVSLTYITGGRIQEIAPLRNKGLKGISPNNISLEADENYGEFLNITLRNNKNKTRKDKKAIAPVKHEGVLINIILDYIKSIDPSAEIFPKCRTSYYRYIKKHARVFQFPHFLRALRVTHLKNKYGFNGTQIKDFMGWSDERPLIKYELWFDPIIFKKQMC